MPKTHQDSEALAGRLGSLKFGAAFSGPEARMVAGYLSEQVYPAGTVIIHEGRRATSMAFLEQGTATIEMEDAGAPERHTIDLSRDAVIGEISFFDKEPRSATVVAKTEVAMLVLTRERFDALALAHPELAIRILFYVGRVLSRRLRQVTGRYVGMLA